MISAHDHVGIIGVVRIFGTSLTFRGKALVVSTIGSMSG